MTRFVFASLFLVQAAFAGVPYNGVGQMTSMGAANRTAKIAEKISVDQKLGDKLPLDLAFRDDEGKTVHLGDYFGKGPVSLALVYYECPSLCGLLMSGLFRGLKEVELQAGKEFRAVFVSINPNDTPALAAKKKASLVQHYGLSDSAAGVHFLTGDQAAITALAKAVGFHYEYDPVTRQYAHPGAAVVLTPNGTISRYHFGVEFPGKDLRLSLVEASGNRIGTAIDHFLLYCYRFDPATGKYGLVIMRSLRLAGVVTLVGMAALIGLLTLWSRRRRSEGENVA